ncbi:MAG: hypothetical protein WAM94_17660 [Chromatiaceae bacterium]
MPLPVLAVDPPAELEQELVQHALQEATVFPPALYPLGAVDLEGRSRVQGRVGVAQIPFVGRDLAAVVQGVGVEQQLHLLLGELRVQQGQTGRL